MRRRIIWFGLGAVTFVYAGAVVTNLSMLSVVPSFLAWTFVIVPIMVGCGAILMWRRPENRIGELLTLGGLVFFLIPTTLEILTMARFERSGVEAWMWAPIAAVLILNSIGIVVICDLVVRLPDGRYRFDRDRHFVRWTWFTVPAAVLLLLSSESAPSHSQAFPGLENVPNQLAIPSLAPLEGLFRTLWGLSYTVFIAAVILQYLRYRSAALRHRKRVRWVLFAGVVAIVVGLVPFALETVGAISPMAHGSATAVVSTLIISVFPIATVIAVMEPPWVDVDIVIRKSIVYALLSFGILFLYGATAAALGLAAGQRAGLEVAIVLTVVIAAAFQPARSRLDSLADRWVFGERPTRYEAVTALGENIERTNEPIELVEQLTRTVHHALDLEWVTAITADGVEIQHGEPSGPAIVETEIGTADEQVGVLRCGPKRYGSIDPEDETLIRTLAGQAGLALVNLQLAGRIVTAAEAERRRIERNIHDGAQQELVALVARLGMARTSAEQGRLDHGDLARLQRDARTILTDLRELAQGIHPSVLTDGGIVAAIEARCTHLPLRVSMESTNGLRRQRFADDIEGAAYFFVAECLANVLKHADASTVKVSIEQCGAELQLAVVDDGHGFDAGLARRNGLAGLTDRMHAMGGSIRISSDHGRGSRVEATLPARLR